MTRPRDAQGSGRRGAWSAALVVGVAVVLVATLPEPPRAELTPPASTVEPVSSTVLACPSGTDEAAVTIASVPVVPGAGAGAGAGSVSIEQSGRDVRDPSLPRGGVTTVPVEPAPVVVAGTGAAARGLTAVREQRVDGTLAVAGCRGARSTWWFSGAGGGVDHPSVLLLTNPDAGPAVVDVRMHGASGGVDEAATRGLVLAPGETSRVPLTRVAPGSGELTVEVVATRGRVVAHVLDTRRGARGDGREWLPPTAPPAEELVIPGIPAGAQRVQLLVSNPGAEQSLVDLEVMTERGAFVPLGAEQLSVDPGTIERVDVTEALRGRAAAVRLSSLVPVTGVARVTGGGDLAYAVAGEPLTGPSGVVLVGESSAVQVATADEAAALGLDVHAADGRRLLRRAVTVPPSGLVQVSVPEDAAYAVLRPRSGGGYAAALHAGAGLAGQPVRPLPSTLVRPSVVPYAGQSDS